jgi:outer membrane receptor protein involved in Fe transport
MSSIYANGGSSFATPALKSTGGTILLSDLGIPGHDGQLPNPNLKPESGISVDGGVDFKFPDSISVSIRAFYTIIQDAIVDNVVSQNPSQTQSINTGNSKATGGEIEVSQYFSDMVSWFANGTYMKTSIKNQLDPDQDNAEIPFSPNVVLNFGMSLYLSCGFTFTTALNYNGGFYDGTSKSGRHWFKPGAILNAYASQRLVKDDTYAVECFIQLYNITNNDFEMPWQFKNPGFSCMGGVKVAFE